MSKMGKRIKIGDIVEVPTSKGLAYAQVTHIHGEEHSSYGPLVRIVPGFFTKRPERFDELVRQKPVAMMFCTLRAAIKSGVCEIVANVPVPEESKKFPLFRGSNNDPGGDAPKKWWFWDGDRTWPVGKISAEQRRMPLREIVDGVLLRERIESGWSPATDRHSR
jgi:hypothetical protein